QRSPLSHRRLHISREQKRKATVCQEFDLRFEVFWRDGEIPNQVALRLLERKIADSVIHQYGNGKLLRHRNNGQRGMFSNMFRAGKHSWRLMFQMARMREKDCTERAECA